MTGIDVVCHHYAPGVGLLLDAALPAARAARRFGVRAHVERHWLHGPHLAVRLTGPADAATAAAEAVRRRFVRHLAQHPATPAVDTAELLRRSVLAGRAELVPGPYEPIQPHGTVLVRPADDTALTDLLGSAAAVELRADLMSRALDAVEVSAPELPDDRGGSGVRVALTAMAAHAAAYPDGTVAGCTSFISHVEEFLCLHDGDGGLRSRFDAVWRRTADTVLPALADAAAGRSDGRLHDRWADWVAEAGPACAAAYRRGDLTMRPGMSYRDRARDLGDAGTAELWDPDLRTRYSAFHQRLRRGDWASAVGDHFPPYRFATNVLYTLLTVCGIRPLDRYLAAYLLGEAAQRLAGTRWRDSPGGWPPELAAHPRPATSTVGSTA